LYTCGVYTFSVIGCSW